MSFILFCVLLMSVQVWWEWRTKPELTPELNYGFTYILRPLERPFQEIQYTWRWVGGFYRLDDDQYGAMLKDCGVEEPELSRRVAETSIPNWNAPARFKRATIIEHDSDPTPTNKANQQA